MPGGDLRLKTASAVTNRTLLVKCDLLVRTKPAPSEALGNSKPGSCHLATTKHLLMIMVRFAQLLWFAVLCWKRNTSSVTAFPLQPFRIPGGGLAWLAWLGRVNFGFKQDP